MDCADRPPAMAEGLRRSSLRCRASDGAEVPFRFLHFQGTAKAMMSGFAWYRSDDLDQVIAHPG
jgi:hypothetical protein